MVVLGKKVRKVKGFQYLGYTLKSNNSDRAHTQEMVQKANKVGWGVGERKFGHDNKRRMTMFDSLIKSVFMYEADIWGWREYEEIERVKEKYLKWTLGLEKYTPAYIVREETKRETMRVEAGKRAVGFEEKFSEIGDCKILQECWK
ncbi:hypothetical protein Zmor_014093 [Zophobas morio]|uniref:Endonuclease-reverse transcriptase n=1 Tax=Zophobas morio TaxID=2755281 RepID=A0AA38IBL3_9CUCU|nr:hypothetical protein Zmor_014093 [Zophobas morio]